MVGLAGGMKRGEGCSSSSSINVSNSNSNSSSRYMHTLLLEKRAEIPCLIKCPTTKVPMYTASLHPLRRVLWTVALFQDSSLSLTLPTACHFLVGSCRKHAGDLTPPLFVSMPPRSWSKPHTPFARDKSCERISPTDSSTSSSPNREL